MPRQEAPGITRPIVDMSSPMFLEFCRDYLMIEPSSIEDAKFFAGVDEDMKFEHIQKAYQENRRAFILKFIPELQTICNDTAATSYPDFLPHKYAYAIIDRQRTTGGSWFRFARETLRITVDKTVVVLANKVLRNEQKHSLLQEWINEAERTVPDPFGELEKRFEEFVDHQERNGQFLTR